MDQVIEILSDWRLYATSLAAYLVLYTLGFFGGEASKAPVKKYNARAAAEEMKKKSTIKYNMEEISKHSTEDDLWIVVDNKVYDITAFIPDHPGKTDALLRFGGKEATEAFYGDQHPTTAEDIIRRYQIGVLDDSQ